MQGGTEAAVNVRLWNTHKGQKSLDTPDDNFSTAQAKPTLTAGRVAQSGLKG